MHLLRILVLHGKGGTGASMRKRFAPIIEALPQAAWEFPTAPHSVASGRAWWLLGQGERSYTASKYEGLDESLELVGGLGEFDVVWGHSQGAIMVAAMLAESKLPSDAKYILNGAAWPAPFDGAMRDAVVTAPTLHVIGLRDEVNPPDQARRIAAIFNGETHEHDGGHIVPVDTNAIAAYRRFIL